MKVCFRLFVQRLADDIYTVSVPNVPGLSVTAATVHTCKRLIARTLARHLANTPAEALEAVGPRSDQTLERVEAELLALSPEDAPPELVTLAVNLMLTPGEGEIGVCAPRLIEPPVFFSLPDRSRLEYISRAVLTVYFQEHTAEQINQLQAGPDETLDEIEVEIKTAQAGPGEQTGQPAPPEQPARSAPPPAPDELDAVGIELTAEENARWLTPAQHRDAEVAKVLSVLAGDRPSLVLIGEPGVGKTAIIHEAVRRIREKQCAESLHGRQVWAVSSSSLIAGQKYIGEWEGRLQKVMTEVRERGAILFVEDLTGLADAGRHDQNNTSMADYLRGYVQAGSVIILGESTPARWRYMEQLNPSFAAQLGALRVEATRGEHTLRIVSSIASALERRDGLRFVPGTLEAAVELTDRFLPYRAQPGKAIRLICQAATDRKQNATAAVPNAAVTAEGVADEAAAAIPNVGRQELVATFTRETGLPQFILADDVPLDLAAVRKHIAERVVGQDAAVDAMVNLVALIKTGLNDPEKPLGSFLFIGPTGVGKTQMVKTLAKYLFGNEERVIRFDMSEYGDPFGVRRLIGAPGSGEEGELTGRVREQPFCVLLLDEFEKAAPEIYDLFLQVLGEGRLTGATGATTSFQNAIVVMTSNLGSSARDQRALGLRADGQGDSGRDAGYWQSKVEAYFRPEFVNRIDQIVPFQPLGAATMRKIARRELGEVLLRQGVARRNLLVEIDDGIIDLLLEQGFSAAYGARPLKRAIEQRVVAPLARFLAGRTGPGPELLRLSSDGDQVTLTAIRTGPEENREQGLLEARPARREEKSRLLNYGDLIEDLAEARAKLEGWSGREAVLEMRRERDARLAATSHPTFWDDPEAAQQTLARFYFLERLLKRLQQLTDKAAYLEELARLVHQQRDAGYRWDLAESYNALARDAAFLEVELLCAHIVRNHSAVLTLSPMPRQSQDEDTLAWLRRLAAMYAGWALRKGYGIEAVASLVLIPESQRATEVQAAYPFRWQRLDAHKLAEPGDCGALVEALDELPEVREVAILLTGANVFGFLKGEAGLHRRSGEERKSEHKNERKSERRSDRKGAASFKEERASSQPGRPYGPAAFVAVAVDPWDGDVGVLDAMLQVRATGKSERGAVVSLAPSEIVRNYQVEGPRYVRDPRTRVRHNDLNAVLAGDLDDFILAYLREIEPANAWEGGA